MGGNLYIIQAFNPFNNPLYLFTSSCGSNNVRFAVLHQFILLFMVFSRQLKQLIPETSLSDSAIIASYYIIIASAIEQVWTSFKQFKSQCNPKS